MNLSHLEMKFPGEGEVALVLAHDDDGELVGTVCVKRAGPVGEFYRLFVVEDRRREGTGRELIEHAAAVARRAGCVALSCSVNPGNKSARLFYTRLGFSTAFLFGDGDLLMTRPIPPLPVVQSEGGHANDSASFCCGGPS